MSTTQPEALAADHSGDATDMVGRWYMVNKMGMATLCASKADAQQEAADAQRFWPHMGPHRAVQLVEVASVAASAGSEPVATVFTMEALTPGGGVKYHATIHKALPAGTKLYTHPSPPEGMVGGWMPIETAPKDGTLILVHFKTKGVRALSWDSPFHDEVTEENGIWCVNDDKHGPYGLRGYNNDGPTAPTHWMPLPPSPTTSAGSGKGE